MLKGALWWLSTTGGYTNFLQISQAKSISFLLSAKVNAQLFSFSASFNLFLDWSLSASDFIFLDNKSKNFAKASYCKFPISQLNRLVNLYIGQFLFYVPYFSLLKVYSLVLFLSAFAKASSSQYTLTISSMIKSIIASISGSFSWYVSTEILSKITNSLPPLSP